MAVGRHRIPLGLGVLLRLACFAPAPEELAGDGGRVKVEKVLHAFKTARRGGVFRPYEARIKRSLRKRFTQKGDNPPFATTE